MNLNLSEQIDLTREASFRLGALEIIPAGREVVFEERREILEPRIMQVLVALAHRRDHVVTRDELIMCCWAGRVVGEDAITRCIGRIRRLSEMSGAFALETIPRLGYRLTENASPDALPVPATGAPRFPRWMSRRPRLLALGALALLAILFACAYWLFRPQAETATVPVRFTIAVLPFSAPPGDHEAEQLGDAIATNTADMLASEGLEVISPTKTRQYRGASKANAPQLLHATFVVDGDIHRDGARIIVSLRIVDGGSGTTLIADSVEGIQPESLPEAVATNVLGSGWGWIPPLNPAQPADHAAIIGILKAVRHLVNPTGRVYAYEYAKQLALERPRDSFAQQLHAATAAEIVPGRHPEHRLPVVLEARAAAQKALELNPELGDAYGPLAAATPLFSWSVREGYLRQGLRLRPTAPLVYMDLIALRMSAGYWRVGARMAEDAFANHPHFDLPNNEAINGRLWAGDPQAAQRLAAHAAAMWPRQVRFHAKLFVATAFYGRPEEAEAFLHDPSAAPLLQPEGEGRTYTAIISALRHGRTTDIQAVVDDCLKVSGRSSEFRQICFLALVKLGRIDDAYRLSEQLYPDQRGATQAEIEKRWLARIPFNTVYLVVPLTAPFRADPRYRDVMERVGLLRFWKERGVAPDFCASENVPLCRELKS